jgi:indole-3-glycerol phosphate synthase
MLPMVLRDCPVLTDGPSFGGSIDDLIAARGTSLPILRKEFILMNTRSPNQSLGAEWYFINCGHFNKEQVYNFSLKAMELLEVILEVHDEVNGTHFRRGRYYCVNNRDLKTFKVDLQQSASLRNDTEIS